MKPIFHLLLNAKNKMQTNPTITFTIFGFATDFCCTDHSAAKKFTPTVLQHTTRRSILLVATFFFNVCFFSAATQTLVTQQNATTQKSSLTQRKLYRPKATQLVF
jgi:hypothetical protein